MTRSLFGMASILILCVGIPGCNDGLLGGEPEGAEGASHLMTSEDVPGAQSCPPEAVAGAASCQSCQKRGMTWQWWGRTVDVDSVGSDSITNAYSGDTTCNTSLPILCIRKVGAPKPFYVTSSFYNGWTGGYIALTRAHVGYDMSSAGAADAICAAELGAGWEMAEFHDGNGGWNFQAYGAATHPERFWASINDQPANCWNSACL